MKTGEVIAWLDGEFHPEYQEDYDNSGFLLGSAASTYRGALVALDLTPAVVDEAAKHGLSLIVTHHPFIFRGVRRLTDGSETGRMVMDLIKNDISVYAAHTNLDNLPWGVNGELAVKLGLRQTRILKPFATDAGLGAGMVGELAEGEEWTPSCCASRTSWGCRWCAPRATTGGAACAVWPSAAAAGPSSSATPWPPGPTST